ncbi:unnamed protein product [Lactuca saligna]|uniref:Uncharacterized protein n=1 Tax=Lactuca saligna TaxID=75948 RepID=A0AA35YCY3_LACSI|nr:unnamed protein product [Lactuca saligna]
MRSRSSSRLGENFKTKFTNTSAPLEIDDDDDFVDPPFQGHGLIEHAREAVAAFHEELPMVEVIVEHEANKLEKIEDSEVNADALRMGNFIRREDDENEDVSNDTDMEFETVEREF